MSTFLSLALPAIVGAIAGRREFLTLGAHGPTVIVWPLLTAGIVVLLYRQGWAQLAGFNGPARWTNLSLALVPFVYACVPLLNLFARELITPVDWTRIGAALVQGLARGSTVAFLEETTFRGLLLAMMLTRYHATLRNVRIAVLFTALLFGLWHFPSALAAPHPSLGIAQLVYPVFMGVGASAVLLRTGSIWLLIAAHALLITMNVVIESVTIDASGVRTSNEMIRTALLSTAIMLPYLIYGLVLLRGVALTNVVARATRE